MRSELTRAASFGLYGEGTMKKIIKTFLMPRSQNVNMAMEYTTWNGLVKNYDKVKNGSNIAVTQFYQSSVEKMSLGKYFGIKDKNEFVLKNDHQRLKFFIYNS
jgi:hypothetical protein